MYHITELEDDCLKNVSDDINMSIPWYIIFTYMLQANSNLVSELVTDRLKDVIRDNKNEIEHKYKEYVNMETYEIEEYPKSTKVTVEALEKDYGKEK